MYKKEYPRPQFVREEWLNLNGEWDFILDFIKGLVAVYISKIIVSQLNAPYETVLFSGFFAQVGHTFPIFYKFRGKLNIQSASANNHT